MTQLDEPVTPSTLMDAAYANDRNHVFHSWSAQGALDPVVIAGASGATFWDADGTTWIDFASQLVNMNIGHQHPKLVRAIQEQAGRLCTVAPSFANDQRSEAARLIVDKANREGELDAFGKVFFTNGGAEGVENAVRLARLHTGRQKILSTYRSYHGGTAAAIGLTGEGRRLENEPSVPGLVKFWGPYPYRSPFHSESPSVRSATCATRSRSRGRRRWRRSCSSPSSAPTGSSSHPTDTSRAFARCATSSGSCGSRTR